MIEELSLSFAASGTRSKSDLAALTDLAETYSGLLFRVAHSILRNSAEAEDVVQDVFVRVMQQQSKAQHDLLPAIRDMRVWLVRIAWNLALDRRRRVRPDQMDGLFADSLAARHLAADAAIEEAQRMKRVFREIERLPSAERQALLLSAVEELSTNEVAQVMNKTDSAIRALLFRARTRLKSRLEKGGYA